MPLLSDEFVSLYRYEQPNWGFNGLGQVVFKRTYARLVEGENRTEEWYETIRRCIEGAQEIGAGYTEKEAQHLFDYMFNLKCSFSGRGLWQLGTRSGKIYGDSLCNCWFVSIKQPKDFCFLFEQLMLGGGVGFSVRRSDINELPKVRKDVLIEHENTNDADYIVPDARQGLTK